MKKKFIVLVVSILLISGITFLAGLFTGISNVFLRRLVNISFNYLNGLVAFFSIRFTGVNFDFDFKNFKQFLVGFCVALFLSFFIAFLPVLFGGNLIGPHIDFSLDKFLFNLFYFVFVIGPVEELIFRVYIQETCMDFFRSKWIGILIASVIFGLWHFINGSFIQVLFTTFIGLIFGFSKFFIKDFKYLGVSFCHGLYDFLNVVIRMFII